MLRFVEMASPSAKKSRLTYDTNDWKPEDYFCVSTKAGDRALCLICRTTFVCKKYNLHKHYNGFHLGKYGELSFPPSEVQKLAVAELLKKLNGEQDLMHGHASTNTRALAASFRVCYELARKKKPAADAELFKNAFLSASSELWRDRKDKDQLLSDIRNMPLSRDSCQRRYERLAEDMFDQLVSKLRRTMYWSLGVDESTDSDDTAQVACVVRFLDPDAPQVCEEFLSLIPLKGRTRGEDICEAIVQFGATNKLNWNTLISVATDGAPCMVGVDIGFVALFRTAIGKPNLLSFHCIIHQQSLIAKAAVQSVSLKETMKTVVSIINKLRSRALNHRLLQSFLSDVEAEYGDVLYYNSVRWLSQGTALRRFISVLDEIVRFMEDAGQAEPSLKDGSFRLELAILTDVCELLNRVNLKLQGRGRLASHLYEEMRIFEGDLVTFLEHYVRKADFSVFHFTKNFCVDREPEAQQKLEEIISAVLHEISGRLRDFEGLESVFAFFTNPLTAPVEESIDGLTRFGVDRNACRFELNRLRNSLALRNAFTPADRDLASIWISNVPDDCPLIAAAGRQFVALFGSTYGCESAFSTMNFIKNKNRGRLVDRHLNQCTLLGCSGIEPRFDVIVKSTQAQGSH